MTTNVKRYAWFREFGLKDEAAQTWPALEAAIGRPVPPELNDIIGYLESGKLVMGTLDKTEADALSPERVEIAPLELLTDGVWVWPNLAAYYIRQHGLEVPGELIEHMRANGWSIPYLTDEAVHEVSLQVAGRVLDDEYFLSMLRAAGWKGPQ